MWFWYVIEFLIVWGFLWWLSRQFKKDPPVNKSSEQYLKEYPELLEEKPEPQINIYYTEVHNHLHINPNEGN